MSLVSPPNVTQTSLEIMSNGVRNGYADPGTNGTSRGEQPTKALAHLQDIKEDAVRGIEKDRSITAQIDIAEKCLIRATASLEYRKPDEAYMYYVRCYVILVETICQNPSWPDFLRSKPARFADYDKLVKRIRTKEEQFAKVKEIVENDNKRNGTKPRIPSALVPGPRTTAKEWHPPTSRFSLPSLDAPSGPNDSDRMNGVASITNTRDNGSRPYSDNYTLSSSPSSPALSSGSPNGGLNERFAKLRMAPRIDTSDIYSPSIYSGSTRESQTSQEFSVTSSDAQSPFGSRVAGPRSMNGTSRPDLSLNAQVSPSMPQLPSPTYSPARNMQISGELHLPRTTARSIVGTGGRSNSMTGFKGSHRIVGGEDDSRNSPIKNGFDDRLPNIRRKSVHLPKETRVGAEKLYDYLTMHNMLLIDCRPRKDFDDGHIWTRSIICIEPTILRRDMSANDLQDALILSPENEQELFSQRDEFDLIVYYDAGMSSDQYLRNPLTQEDWTLRNLHEALFEFNDSKPLQRPPILLMGGIAAWRDLVGSQALERSDTAAKLKPAIPKRRIVTPGYRISNSKRRLRDYNPLDADEERNWRERARKESVVVEPRSSDGHDQPSDPSPMALDSIEEFNRRFPEASDMGTQAVIRDYREVPQPPLPPKVPDYPAPLPRTTSSALPIVPTRPAPAAPRMSYSGVNERSVSQPLTNQPNPYANYHMPQVIYRLPRTGLVNFGNTCYMNATIQALSCTIPLSHFFLNDYYQALVQRDNWKGSKGVLPDLFANLIRSIWKGDVKAIRPGTLRAFCARLNHEWGMDNQQDAKEFLDFLVDVLHEDFNQNWTRSPLKALTEEQEHIREKTPKLAVCRKEWERYTHRELSFITTLFGGQHCSKLTCMKCRTTSTTYEAFFSISVEIPRSGKSTTIEDCLRSYCQEEKLSGDEVWKCPRCKQQREATKKITITRAPQFLIIHFKRFSAGKNETAKKIRMPIAFPLHGLDLGPYMLPSISQGEREQIADQYKDPGLTTDPTMTAPYKYDAYAVMRHIGTTLSEGHYTCLARDRALRKWRDFNDVTVEDFDPLAPKLPPQQKLDNEMAYIVFYERTNS